MKNRLINLARIILTYIRYINKVYGWGIIIKRSQLVGKRIKILSNCLIIRAFIKNDVVIFSNSQVTDTTLAGCNKVGSGCSFGSSSIGEFSYVADHGVINNTTIGKYCSIGPNFIVGYGSHPTQFISTSPMFYSPAGVANVSYTKGNFFEEYKHTTIGNDVWIGANVFIMDGLEIGDGAIIGTGSVVTHNVEPYAIVGGVPAKVIKYRYEPEIIEKIRSLNWWDKDHDWIIKNIESFQKPIRNTADLEKLSN